MKTSARLMAAVAAATLVATVTAGCSQVGQGGSGSGSGSGDATHQITFVNKIDGIAWYERSKLGLNQYTDETGNPTTMVGPAGADPALQNQVIQQQIAAGADGLIINPVSSSASDPVAKQAMDAGIAVISHEATDMQSVDFDIEAFEAKPYGENMMKQLAELMGEKGQYVAWVGSLSSKSHNAFIDAAVAYQKEHYPDMTLVTDRIEDNEDQQGAQDKMVELMATYPDLKGSISCSMSALPGIARAVEDKGKEDRIAVVGTSLVSVAGQYLKTGAADHIMFWDPSETAFAAAALANLVIEGRSDEVVNGIDLGIDGYHSVKVDGKVVYGDKWIDVTAENMDEYDF
ncbi:substrate-binding domain-containing protein [Microbacterium aerolatum]|uniref:Autoinducer 2 ABC transporter substrate-binding protein n=1 Tax=Microbacterium aerolatum TaxID=153731 RepID=A0A511AC80_9MICO|nr:substrate-binding domain-containing protein [Microbacterium aerolatum]GEK85682.1 autoinducer 2 ABC transporter substrate-binding protein [Microbacterium aerolatum]GGB21218.1 autoinducer 2 ABC transporter substrate-binding protein [Microbacterium aerolatum]